MTLYKRHITDKLLTALADTPVVFLNGARQTGKSTLVRAISQQAKLSRYLTFDDPAVLMAAKNDPLSFINGIHEPVVLDEIQHVPELFPAIKLTIDNHRQSGRFLLTGSANVLLLPSLSESLAGRMEILSLYPLSQGEIIGKKEHFIDHVFSDPVTFSTHPASTDRQSWIKKIITGGYPEALTRAESRRKAWFDAYITTILQRDIRDLANIEGLIRLPNLLKLLATRTAGLLNLSDLSRSIQIPHTTLTRYLTLLEATFLCVLVPAWSHNLGTRLVKSPKIHLNDTGLVAAQLGLNEERCSEDTMLLGRLLENLVVMELLKQSSFSHTQPELFHFRSSKGQEVDIILEDARGRCVGIEVKSSASLRPSDLSGLEAFAELAGERFHQGILLYLGKEVLSLRKNIIALPLDKLFDDT